METRLVGTRAAPTVVASVLLLAISGCGTQSATTVTAPTPTTGSTVAVTAPGVDATPALAPLFSATPAPSTVPVPVPITALGRSHSTSSPAASSTSTSTPSSVTPRAVAGAAPAADNGSQLQASALRIVQAPISFSDSRKQEMAAYSLRHYGSASWQLNPTMIVLHYTAGGTAASTRAVFAADTPNAGELPGTCAHFVVDTDGTVYQLVPTTIRCRHTIGLNDQAIGIEMVQGAGSSSSWADQQILARPAQVGAALALVRQLQGQYGIATSNVVGHATANSTPQFHDLTGARNDHTDWLAADLAVFRSRL